MSATFPYQCDWAPSPTMEPSRLKVAFGDGYEQRASAGLNPFLASYDLAFSVRSEAEANAIYAWLQFNNAHVDPFYWDPTWISTTASGEQFGTGDGARSQWRLSKSGIYVSRDIILDSITREDWQGVVDLSPMNRTNRLRASQEFDNVVWGKSGTGGSSVTANATTAPDGTTTADKFIPGAVAGTHYLYQNCNYSALTYVISAFAKAAEYSTVRLFAFGSGVGVLANLSTGSVSVAGGSPTAYGAIPIGNGWYRVWMTAMAPSTGTNAIQIYSGDNTAGDGTSGIYVWGAQMELGAAVGGYIFTSPSSTYSLTDYTHASGQITLGQVPVSGAVLRWGGSGKTHLRWIADKWTPPEPVSYNNWRVQATFRQVP